MILIVVNLEKVAQEFPHSKHLQILSMRVIPLYLLGTLVEQNQYQLMKTLEMLAMSVKLKLLLKKQQSIRYLQLTARALLASKS